MCRLCSKSLLGEASDVAIILLEDYFKTNIWILSVAVTMGTYLIKWGLIMYITQFGIWEHFSDDTSACLTNNMIIQKAAYVLMLDFCSLMRNCLANQKCFSLTKSQPLATKFN